MPTRPMRPRKNDGLKQFIPMLYQKPVFRFLRGGDPWDSLRDLIYGPDDIHTAKFFSEDVRQAGFAKLAALQELWGELRDDIISAQQQYQPDKKPWGCRFDANLAKKTATVVPG